MNNKHRKHTPKQNDKSKMFTYNSQKGNTLLTENPGKETRRRQRDPGLLTGADSEHSGSPSPYPGGEG